MRKEVVWAVVAGIALGLVVAFGVWRINSSVSSNTLKKDIVQIDQTPTPIPQGPSEFKVVIDKPTQNDVVTENSVTVSGLTKPGHWLTLSGEAGDYIIQSDATGAFLQDVSLSTGVNHIKVFAIDDSGKQTTANVDVVYSSAFQPRQPTTSPPDSGASESSVIRQKVAQDLANTLNSPKAYIGVVTDITDSTIEIKTASSDIQQISISATDTNVVNIVGTSDKQVKTTDVAIGDSIIAMGYIQTSSVLGAQRILITDPITNPKISVSLAKIVSNTKKGLAISGIADDKAETILTDSKTKILSLADGKFSVTKLGAITTDDKVIYVFTTDDKGVVTIRSVFVIPQS